MTPKYVGHGDPNDAANDVAVLRPVATRQPLNWAARRLLTPDYQMPYAVKDGKLATVASK
jgi:hypothetical protein